MKNIPRPFKAIKHFDKSYYTIHSNPKYRDGYHWMGAIGTDEWSKFFGNKQYTDFIADWCNIAFALGVIFGKTGRVWVRTIIKKIKGKKTVVSVYKVGRKTIYIPVKF